MTSFLEELESLTSGSERIGIVIVDHGSRRDESNTLLEEVAGMFARVTQAPIVEPAHMELAEPSIATAYGRCVERGATLVVVFPYFLSPGRHWNQDIPQLAAEAAKPHSGVRYVVTAPLGLHDAMARVMQERITHCLNHVLGGGEACDLCAGATGCQLAH